MTSRIVRVLVDGRGHVVEFAVRRLWPLGIGWYCMVLALAPSGRGMYGFESHAFADTALWFSAALLFASAAFPDRTTIGTAAMFITTWTLMGRGVSFAYRGDDYSPLDHFWPNVVGASLYAVVTLAEVILHLIQVAISIDRRTRG